MVKGICLQPQLEKDFCWNFTKLQPVQLTIIMTMSSKVPEMSKKRSMEKECRFRASGAGNDPPAKCDMFRVVRKELQGQVSASKGTSRMMELRWESYDWRVTIPERFIENFFKIAKPLTLLTQKNKTYVWGDKQDEAFQILKEKLCNAHVLALPDGPDDFDGLQYIFDQIGFKYAPKAVIELLSDNSVRQIPPRQGEQWWADALTEKKDSKPRRMSLRVLKIKAEHQNPQGFLHRNKIPEWKWEKLTMTLSQSCLKLAVGIYHTSIKCAPFEALYGRKCRSPVIWTEVGESQLIGPRLVKKRLKNFSKSMKDKDTSRIRARKSYADKEANPLEFDVETECLLKENNRHDAKDAWGIFWIARIKDLASDEELEELMKDQPLSVDASPTALSPGYIANSDSEVDKEDPEEDPADHPADG
ncbi:hypothetical protein Tco_0940615 [Tanacetum coccineum]|uniref:Reverse transcriptase/retrotransposon-derived protein RNase H-like domain-containing protein n=1 Tax=Tanacetum coccineum TaxID=301880 RepID=A0ABQ5DP32_9ASTR